METLWGYYREFFVDGDPRVSDWALMGHPWQVLGLVLGYNYFVKVQGPAWMKNRKPMNLRTVMLVYDVVMAVVSGTIAYLGVRLWLRGEFTAFCHPLDMADTPRTRKLLSFVWWYLVVKIVELLETVFFVLRKKNKQVSALHVLHHSAQPLLTWYFLKHTGSEDPGLTGIINCSVHTVMYTYYGLASLGDSIQKYLWWKKYLTILQMVQFAIDIVHGMVLAFYDCGLPLSVTVVGTALGVVYLVMFMHFYIQSFKAKTT